MCLWPESLEDIEWFSQCKLLGISHFGLSFAEADNLDPNQFKGLCISDGMTPATAITQVMYEREMDKTITATIEQLFHFSCPTCSSGWSIGDYQISRNDTNTITCPKCKTTREVKVDNVMKKSSKILDTFLWIPVDLTTLPRHKVFAYYRNVNNKILEKKRINLFYRIIIINYCRTNSNR